VSTTCTTRLRRVGVCVLEVVICGRPSRRCPGGSMLVQRVVMPVSSLESWTVLGDEGGPVEPVERYLAYLTDIERSPNTVKAYAHDLKDWFGFLEVRGLDWREVRLEDLSTPREHPSPSRRSPLRPAFPVPGFTPSPTSGPRSNGSAPSAGGRPRHQSRPASGPLTHRCCEGLRPPTNGSGS
jgi:hypothetical protein